MILISIFMHAGVEEDRWSDFPHLLCIGDKGPARGFKPSSGKRPIWRITDRVVDYRAGQVTYQVEPA